MAATERSSSEAAGVRLLTTWPAIADAPPVPRSGPGPVRAFQGRQLDQIAMPLGGIGTGTISLGGWGQLRDFEIFNRPAKGLQFRETFLALHVREAGSRAGLARVLQGPVGGDHFTGAGMGVFPEGGAGLPRFREAWFEGAYPFGRVQLRDKDFPLEVAVEGWNPLIPGEPDDSGLPAAMFNVLLRNTGRKDVQATLYASLENRTGHPHTGRTLNEVLTCGGVRGLVMRTRRHEPASPRFGTLAIVTPHTDVKVQTKLFRGGWFDTRLRWWEQIAAGDRPEELEPAATEADGHTDVGAISLAVKVPAGGAAILPVWITWHTPIFEKYWHGGEPKPTWKNHYAKRFADAAEVAEYLGAVVPKLEERARRFAAELLSSALPPEVLDAVSSQLSVLRSTTCLRLEDGTFYAFEGCHPDGGCCEGTCSHVWNYAQALAWLFPTLERSIRDADYAINLRDDGHVTFRMPLPLGVIPPGDFHAAADGQLGGIVKVYREWQIGGCGAWLRRIWPSARRALQYAWKVWDTDRDGLIEGVQHNTYDIEFYGPNTMVGTIYLAALAAAERIAAHLGERDFAETCRTIRENGARLLRDRLFNGEYFVQQVKVPAGVEIPPFLVDPDHPGIPKYQYGEGCLSDQLLGAWIAWAVGLDAVLPRDLVGTALQAIHRHNFKPTLHGHANPSRIYALDDEAGLLLASWPRGGRPAFPFPYADEVWCGIEYQVASHLIAEGLVDEGLAIVRGVRARHDGSRRNPWNEFECGNHYARSLASYALLAACSGFSYSAPRQRIGLAPRLKSADFRVFFAVDGAWGSIGRRQAGPRGEAWLSVAEGGLTVREFLLPEPATSVSVEHAGKSMAARVARQGDRSVVRLEEPVIVRAGEDLIIRGN